MAGSASSAKKLAVKLWSARDRMLMRYRFGFIDPRVQWYSTAGTAIL